MGSPTEKILGLAGFYSVKLIYEMQEPAEDAEPNVSFELLQKFIALSIYIYMCICV